MKKFRLFLLVFLLSASNLFAVEGMWVLALIQKNYAQMKALGFQLTPEDIYSINHSSLKDAVVALDGGSCTAEVISPNGLLLTNHHCGYEEIQSHSTVEHDYLKNGFWANSYEEELPNPGKEAWFLVRMEDVTARINSQLTDDMTEEQRNNIIETVSDEIIAEATDGNKYYAEVKDFYDGNVFYLFVYLIYKDVRLVGAPPSSIGKYGGDTDNWMWPRHTGDFSIFRIYAAPDGSPAEYSPDNVPLKTNKFLKLNIQGINKGDFTMIMGYPGSTNRYLTSWEVKQLRDHENSIRIQVRDKKLNILKKYMDQNDKIRIQYAANYAQCANYYKYSIGQNLGIKRLKVIKKKQKIEKQLKKWYGENYSRKQKYDKMFTFIKEAIKNHKNQDIALNYWFESIYLGPAIFNLGLDIYREAANFSMDEKDEFFENLQKIGDKFFKDYTQKVDKDLFVNLMKIYADNVDKKYLPNFLENQTIEQYADYIYNNSHLTDQEKFNELIKTKDVTKIMKDPVLAYVKSMLTLYFTIINEKKDLDKNYYKGRRLYMDALMQMETENNPNRLFYPDANSTMRLTYGTVKAYSWQGKQYNYFTTIDEYVEKGKKYADNPEFEMDSKMVELYEKKDYGQYAAEDGTLHLCFITDNDITGGNSGSPVINGKGELIGVAFDGNWEAMSGDIIFEEPVQRTICVDIRYVLFVIDKVAENKHIMSEIQIIK